MPLRTAAPDFIVRLRAFDPALRVRWSDGQDCWRLERRVSRGQVWPPSAIESVDAFEDRIAARDGYILVDRLPLDGLNDRLLHNLRRADLWHRGADCLMADLDRLDAETRLQARQRAGEQFEAAARERWRYMNRVRTVPEKYSHTAPLGGMSIGGGA